MNLRPRAVVLFAVLTLACSPSAQPVAAPPTAQRIVSLLPSFTQIVAALEAGDRIVGRTQFCPTHGVNPEAAVVGAALDANYEKIMSLRPDLVLVQKSMTLQQQRLEALGLAVLPLPTDSIADAYTAISRLAERVGRPAVGDALIARLRAELEAVRAEAAGRPAVRTLISVGHAQGELREVYVAPQGTFLDELLTITGGVNLLPPSPAVYPQLGVEEIMRLDPDVILVFLPGQDDGPAGQAAERRLWSALPYLKAVKANRIYAVGDLFALSPGPDMAKTARAMMKLLHGTETRS